MSKQASSMISKGQWLAFADRLIAFAYAIFAEAKISITETLFGEPKILSLALLCRTVGNFKGVVALTKEGLVVQARTLTRSCYENLYYMVGLIEQGDDFVKAMHQDQILTFRSQGEFLLREIDDVWGATVTRRYVDVLTLELQEQYFSYADALLTYANYQLRFQAGELREQIFAKPEHVAQPPLYLAEYA